MAMILFLSTYPNDGTHYKHIGVEISVSGIPSIYENSHISSAPPVSGDWIIDEKTIIKDDTLIVNGSIIVTSTGELILLNSEIYMNLDSDGQYRIDVYGNITIVESKITAYNTEYNYYIRVFYGAKLHIENSEISYAGYTEGDFGDKTGLWINTSYAVIINAKIHHNYYGIYIGTYSNYDFICGNTFEYNNIDGLLILGGMYNYICDNTIQENYGRGMDIRGSYNYILNNTIRYNGDDGIYIYAGDYNIIYGNNIYSNDGDGICCDVFAKYNRIYGNTIRNNGDEGIQLSEYSEDNRISFNNFIDNSQQYYCYRSEVNRWISINDIRYTYGGYIHINKLGNYWDDYTGSDSDHDGVGETPYTDTCVNDTRPLIDRISLYDIEDSDADGLHDLFEEALGTDATSSDTDHDGIPDGWEVEHGLNPSMDDSSDDNDGDGLTNLEEYQQSTNPMDYDTDNDGLADGWEVNHGIDPTDNDTDDDGWSDYEEVEYGTDPSDPQDYPTTTTVIVDTAAPGEGKINITVVIVVVCAVVAVLIIYYLRRPREEHGYFF